MKSLEEHLSPVYTTTRLLKYFLIGLSLIISVLYGMHHLLWLHDVGWDFQNTIFITSFKPYDANHYLAQLKDVYEGHYLMSNVFIAEYKDTVPPFWPAFPFYLVTFIGKILHLDVQYIALLMDFTLPPLIFIFASTLLATIGDKKRAGHPGSVYPGTHPSYTAHISPPSTWNSFLASAHNIERDRYHSSLMACSRVPRWFFQTTQSSAHLYFFTGSPAVSYETSENSA